MGEPAKHTGQRFSHLQNLAEEVGSKQERKEQARSEHDGTVWFGIGMFGLVGWSVVVPPVLGCLLGMWIDTLFPSRYSWTLMLLFIGLVFGCATAWRWVQQEGTSPPAQLKRNAAEKQISRPEHE